MKLKWRIDYPLIDAGERRVVHFVIEDIRDEDRLILTRYGRPKVPFVPGNDVANDWIWTGGPQFAAFESAVEAEAHIANVREAFVNEVGRLRARLKANGLTGKSGEVEA